MSADCKPSLSSFGSSIEEHVRDGLAPLPSGGETSNGKVPYHFPTPEGAHLPQSDTVSAWHLAVRQVVPVSKQLASKISQINSHEGKCQQAKRCYYTGSLQA